ncbi:transmembrane protein 234 homolog [Macadamia integrifolia]|uniref:transmembrane protein 234 homolog n=1 Tax=Macadamia integrifolia TaxID=60698 RepID=UPI001C4FA3F1|nr:transmembrane protein 234 homolog [Macadamia integrifolia]
MRDVEKMIAIGLVWGVTNSLMRKGALLWDQKLQSSTVKPQRLPQLHRRLLGHLNKWVDLLLVWQYSVPFLLNLSASATFFAVLSDSPISLAVPVTNATTFAATTISAMLLGEETRVGFALFGTFLIVLGVWFCIM